MKIPFSSMTRRGPVQNAIIAAVLLLAAILCYSNSLHNAFMMDDISLLLKNPKAQNLKYLSQSFLPERSFSDETQNWSKEFYRPVVDILPSLCYPLFRENPFGYHTFNLFLFYLCGLALFFFWLDVTGKRILAFLGSLFFLVHPMNGFVVNYITTNVFAVQFLFQIIALAFFLKARKTPTRSFRYDVLALLAYCSACLCHESAMILPLYLLATFWILKKKSFLESLKACRYYFLLFVLQLLFRFKFSSVQGSLIDKIPVLHINLFEYIATFLKLIFWYFSNLVFPHNIVLFWLTWPVRDHLLLWNLGFVALAIAAVYLFFYLRQRSMFAGWSWAMLMIGIVPVTIGCFIRSQSGLTIEPHWLFFPSIGFFALLAMSCLWLYQKRSKILGLTVIIFLALSFLFISRAMNEVWKTPKSYSLYWLKQVPNYKSINFWLAGAYLEEKNLELAKEYFSRSLENRPTDWQALSNLGLIELGENDPDKAIKYFKKALEFYPSSAVVCNNLGAAYMKQGRQNDAQKAFYQSIHFDPLGLEGRYGLIQIYHRQEKYLDAERLCRENLNIAPKDRLTWVFLMETQFLRKEPDLVVQSAQELLAHSDDVPLLVDIGNMFALRNYLKMSFEFFSKALKLDPKNKEALISLGKFLANLKEYDKAISLWQDAAKLYPKDKRFPMLIDQANVLKNGRP
ncbi:MAG: tetratricopeptide repeat protein [Candidatus Omnitrophica bacterium]|nr:tetratricopeptide repeat protein [Candidatus Omnitrophota bacterium]